MFRGLSKLSRSSPLELLDVEGCQSTELNVKFCVFCQYSASLVCLEDVKAVWQRVTKADAKAFALNDI